MPAGQVPGAGGTIPDQGVNLRLAEVLPCMEGFHRRYMNSNRVSRYRAVMVRELDVSMMVSQHGRALSTRATREFVDWLEQLECGVDLLGRNDCRLP